VNNKGIPILELASIGDLRADGLVFWIDFEDITHGLVYAIQN
jgi:hypothetical protein